MRVLKTLAVAGVAAGAAAMASMANAVIVNTWSYIVTSQFVLGSECFVNSLINPADQSGLGCPTSTPDPAFTSVAADGSSVSWGQPFGQPLQSSLVISKSPATGKINTTTPPFSVPLFGDGEIGPTQIFTHNNNVVLPPALDFITVLTTLSLTPIDPPGGVPGSSPPVTPALPASFTIPVNFKETINFGDCDPPSTQNPPVACPDIFVAGAFNPFSFSYDFDGAGGEPAQTYFVQIFPIGGSATLAPLSPAACAKAGAATGCIGFITEEGLSNNVQFAFALTTQPFSLVPEPGTLALFALGLVGLGYMVRRKQA